MPNPQLQDTQKVPYHLTEFDADQNPTPGVSTDVISIVSSDPASLTVVQDPVPVPGFVASGFILGGSKLQAGVTITVTVTHADGTSLSVVDTIDVVGGQASSLSLGLGDPVAQ